MQFVNKMRGLESLILFFVACFAMEQVMAETVIQHIDDEESDELYIGIEGSFDGNFTDQKLKEMKTWIKDRLPDCKLWPLNETGINIVSIQLNCTNALNKTEKFFENELLKAESPFKRPELTAYITGLERLEIQVNFTYIFNTSNSVEDIKEEAESQIWTGLNIVLPISFELEIDENVTAIKGEIYVMKGFIISDALPTAKHNPNLIGRYKSEEWTKIITSTTNEISGVDIIDISLNPM